MHCQKCGSKNLDSAKFCKSCGSSLSRVGSKIPQNESGLAILPKKRNNLVIGIAIVMILLVLGIVIVKKGWYANPFNKSKEIWQQSTNQPSTTSAENKVAANSACGSQVRDADGNTYGTVLVGTQCWMASNMKVGKQIDGTAEPSDNQKIEKWCYDDDKGNCDSDGGLYNWDEAMRYSTSEGAQGICPDGWHIPTDEEQYTLENYLKDPGEYCDANSEFVDYCAPAGKELQSGGVSGLDFPLSGSRDPGGFFYGLGAYAVFWSSSQSGSSAWYRGLGSGISPVSRNLSVKAGGFSVRCLKD